jgi:2'-5' RNA ligase
VRLFIAFDVPREVREALGNLIAQLKPQNSGVRWANPEGMHVTLKFIGHAIATGDTERLDAARAALVTVRSDRPVEIKFRGIGFFPNAKRPRVLWCGVEATDNLAQLAADIDRALVSVGIPSEERVLVPHLTLARFKSARSDKSRSSSRNEESGHTRAELEKLVRSAAELARQDFGSARETEFHLFESVLKPSGAEYTKIETYSFVRGIS